MPWNGSGQFTRNFSWVNDASNSIPITASRVDSDTNDITTNGFGNTLTRDGQGSATANLPMNGFKHTNAAPGVASTDYATMGQISGLAPLASPVFTGTPTAPTATAGTNTTQIATTAFVSSALTSYLPLSGGTMTGSVNYSSAALLTTTRADNSWSVIVNDTTNATRGGLWVYSNGLALVNNRAGFTALTAFDNGTLGWSGGAATFNSSVGATNAILSGIVTLGGVNQPTIFVQSATPTARNVGDLWFF